jgi:hypothetical protein
MAGMKWSMRVFSRMELLGIREEKKREWQSVGEGFGEVNVEPAGALVILAWLARTDVVDDGASGDLGNGVCNGRRRRS